MPLPRQGQAPLTSCILITIKIYPHSGFEFAFSLLQLSGIRSSITSDERFYRFLHQKRSAIPKFFLYSL
ncbi:hypothetical protein DACRYDRAFT_21117 [Dacryopinax primogenitus]|uniref:Uncharacterized protein n=1 Tax=Dacryopinax primogenitus (strain DJM 731) TaxID=1858805 RepID=M5G5S9_DACPD|nr:uncharacterized protein DACRYDRAFT_21117 [Dacryopinax primogenitus]EJU03570.1 hypothetical protein DACRYDRAFT_21117 [Dacryopinax primogenitus]